MARVSLLYIFGILPVLLTLASCKKTEFGNKKPIPYNGPAVMFEEINTLYSEDAVLRVKLESPLQLVQQNGDVLYPKGLKMTVYEVDGTKTSIIRADSAIYLKEEEKYSAFRKVEVVNIVEMQRVNTDELHWDKRKKEIFTSKPITITTPNETIYGVGMTSNETFSRYKIWKTNGIFTVAEGGAPNMVVRDSSDFKPQMQAPNPPNLQPNIDEPKDDKTAQPDKKLGKYKLSPTLKDPTN